MDDETTPKETNVYEMLETLSDDDDEENNDDDGETESDNAASNSASESSLPLPVVVVLMNATASNDSDDHGELETKEETSAPLPNLPASSESSSPPLLPHPQQQQQQPEPPHTQQQQQQQKSRGGGGGGLTIPNPMRALHHRRSKSDQGPVNAAAAHGHAHHPSDLLLEIIQSDSSDDVFVGSGGSAKEKARKKTKASPVSNREKTELDEKKPQYWRDTVEPETLSKVSVTEQKRQEVIFEIVNTEEQYHEDLKMMIKYFLRPVAAGEFGMENPKECSETMFGNLEEIAELSGRLLEDLNARTKEAAVVSRVGDIFLNHVSSFSCYIGFCTKQILSLLMIHREQQSNKLFREYCDAMQRKRRSRRLPLKSFIGRPRTRLARYVLLLEQLLKFEETPAAEREALEETISKYKEILKDLNQKAGAFENRVKIQNLSDRIVLEEDEANELDLELDDDNRQLLLTAYMRASQDPTVAKVVKLCLFDHAILMLTPRNGHVNVANVDAEYEDEPLKIYKQPITLDSMVVISEPAELSNIIASFSRRRSFSFVRTAKPRQLGSGSGDASSADGKPGGEEDDYSADGAIDAYRESSREPSPEPSETGRRSSLDSDGSLQSSSSLRHSADDLSVSTKAKQGSSKQGSQDAVANWFAIETEGMIRRTTFFQAATPLEKQRWVESINEAQQRQRDMISLFFNDADPSKPRGSRTDTMDSNSSTDTAKRNQSLKLRKKDTVVTNNHEFLMVTYMNPTWCEVCSKFIWGLSKQGWQCKNCNINAHSRCVTEVAMHCPPLPDELKSLKQKLKPGFQKTKKPTSPAIVIETDDTAEKTSTGSPQQQKGGSTGSLLKPSKRSREYGSVNGHAFVLVTLRSPTWCSFCKEFVWGLKSQCYKCQGCGKFAHFRCLNEGMEPCDHPTGNASGASSRSASPSPSPSANSA